MSTPAAPRACWGLVLHAHHNSQRRAYSCDGILSLPTCRRWTSQEIDAREGGGEFVAGALGVGGAHPMRTTAERLARAAAAAAAEVGDETAVQVGYGTLVALAKLMDQARYHQPPLISE